MAYFANNHNHNTTLLPIFQKVLNTQTDRPIDRTLTMDLKPGAPGFEDILII